MTSEEVNWILTVRDIVSPSDILWTDTIDSMLNAQFAIFMVDDIKVPVNDQFNATLSSIENPRLFTFSRDDL